LERRLVAILAADVAGYSRLMASDEVGTLERLQRFRREIFDPQIASHGGRLVKLMGDGALVEFMSVTDAIECATSIQAQILQANAPEPKDSRIEIRIGINLGEVIVDGHDIYGDGVNIAARLEGIAETGGIAVSGTAYDQLRAG
jgi:adenylate cyclase